MRGDRQVTDSFGRCCLAVTSIVARVGVEVLRWERGGEFVSCGDGDGGGRAPASSKDITHAEDFP